MVLILIRIDNDATRDREALVTNILQQVESLGKLELVRYNFQEIVEVKEFSDELDLGIFKLKAGQDAEIVLIVAGQSVGCVDLTTLTLDDLNIDSDTLSITLPHPEICYTKVDLQNSRIYSLKTGWRQHDGEFVEEAYRQAEKQLEESAKQSGILSQTQRQSELILKPLLERIADRPVKLIFPFPTVAPSLDSEF